MEKQTVFIKRYLSKGELPTVDDREYLTDKGLLKFEKGKWFSWWQDDQYTPSYPNYFLEEIELPSDEDVQSRSRMMSNGNAILRKIFTRGANFILNHLKSNTNETDKI